MASSEKRLNRGYDCGKCGGFIPAGTSLDNGGIHWNATARQWEHDEGRCYKGAPDASTSRAPAPAPATAIARQAPVGVEQWGFTPEQVSLIKDITAPRADLTDRELTIFLYTARRLGLDPVARQVYAVKYTDSKSGQKNMNVLTSIDGYRSIAARTGHLDGQDEPVFGPEVEADGGKFPEWARVTVYRKGASRGFTASVRWKEVRGLTRDGKLTRFWESMPYTMLGKCAESRALRMAFAADLSGVYTEDEMGQAENPLPGPSGPDAPKAPLSREEKAKAVDIAGTPSDGGVAEPGNAGGRKPSDAGSSPAAASPPRAKNLEDEVPSGAVDETVVELRHEIEGMLNPAGNKALGERRREFFPVFLKAEGADALPNVEDPAALDRIRTLLLEVR